MTQIVDELKNRQVWNPHTHEWDRMDVRMTANWSEGSGLEDVALCNADTGEPIEYTMNAGLFSDCEEAWYAATEKEV